MTTPSTSPGTGDSNLTALLEPIRLRIARRAVSPRTEAEGEAISDSMLLLAAIDAVLELADTLTDDVVLTSELRTRLREAIRTSLAGDSSNEKGAGDGS